MQVRNIFFNPFIVHSLSWLLVLSIYGLGWSELYPQLPTEVLFFFAITITMSGLFGIFLHCKKCFRYIPLEYDLFQVKKWIRIYLILNLLEVIYSREIPAINLILGHGVSIYGIPILHPFVVTFGIFLSLYIFHMMISTEKEKRKSLILYFGLSFASVIIIFGRGLMFLVIIGCLIIYIYSRRIHLITLLRLSCAISIILFLFGLAGNLRIGTAGVKIVTIGQATEKFEKSWTPDAFFWSYIYMSSPMANLAFNIDPANKINQKSEVGKMIYTEILPETITKRISAQEKAQPDLITSALNVSSVYTRCYVVAGWLGMILMFIYIMIFLVFFLLIITPRSPYFIVLITVLNIMMIGNVFDNMMNYVLSYTLFFPVWLSLKKNVRFHFKTSQTIVK